ncbi:MAG: flagellar biosynthetic protein FliR [Planctomycetes bacterium]|nr:flagellar biosynthetic protein FliR [Planctomycetota bacterium]
MLDYTLKDFHTFMLLLFRITGFFMIAPFFGSNLVPIRVKILLSLMFAIILKPLVSQIEISPTAISYAVFIFNELSIGLFVGFIMMTIFTFIQVGGQLIDHELGLSLANIIDPITQEQTSVIGQFKILITTLIFILIDGHLTLLSTFMDTFKIIPIAHITFPENLYKFVCFEFISDLFKLSVKMSAPVLIASIVTTIALGFMTRAFPEFNLFSAGFNLRILIILIVYLIAIPVIITFISHELVEKSGALYKMILKWS